MIYKFFTFLILGFGASRTLYHRTHGGDLPESAGLVAGGLLVLAAFCALFDEANRDRAAVTLAAAFAAVGIGVGVHRLEMAVKAQ